MKIAKQRLNDSIFLLEFATQYELAATFLRVQEHYESRRFRGRIFSLEDFMDWYAGEFGNFTYYEDWSGFNVPSSALRPFYDGRFDPLLKKEQRLLDLFERSRTPFYVLGVARDTAPRSLVTLQHEVAHALFHTDAAYRREVRALLKPHDTSRLKRDLLSQGYCRQVLTDEVHAYLISEGVGSTPGERRRWRPLRRRLRAVYHEHARHLDLG